MSIFLTQEEADYLFDLNKIPEDDKTIDFPSQGEKISLKFTSFDKREIFIFDITRAYIKLDKVTYQKRARKAFVLRRLDINGQPHLNPLADKVPFEYLEPYNGIEIPCPHLHIYVEGYHHKWAIPANDIFNALDKEMDSVLNDFLQYCNVIKIPAIQKILF